jgi:acetyl-CoA carboxylase biotin carboxyl carrier protein
MSVEHGGRLSRPEVTAKAVPRDDGKIEVRAPGVGLWRHAPRPGSVVVPGQLLGELETLAVLTALRAPANAAGLVVEALGAAEGRARRPVAFGDVLLVLDPAGVAVADALVVASARRAAAPAAEGLVFRSPSSGRYYATPGPGKEPFVRVGDVIGAGQTVALLEVMKTFNRVQYGGEGLPERARVRAIVPAPESDLAPGDVLLELEPA